MASWSSCTIHCSVAGFSIEHFLLSRRLAEVLRSAGLSVNTGTINEVELALRAIELAAPDAICTDRPIGLRAELGAAGFDAAPKDVRVPAAAAC